MTQHNNAIAEIFKNDIAALEDRALEIESIGWIYLSEGAYLHEGSDRSCVIQVVGTAKTNMSESNILWLL